MTKDTERPTHYVVIPGSESAKLERPRGYLLDREDRIVLGNIGLQEDDAITGWRLNPGTVTIGSSTSIDLNSNSFELAGLRSELATATNEIASSKKQLAAVQRQLSDSPRAEQMDSLQSEVSRLSTTMDQALTSIAQAQKRTNNLAVPVVYPAPEDMKIRLVPTYWLDRLEEYRSDEGWALLVAGMFAGAIFGVLGNWFTNLPPVITPYSLLFLGLLIVGVIGSGFWANRIRKRENTIRVQMMQFDTSMATRAVEQESGGIGEVDDALVEGSNDQQ